MEDAFLQYYEMLLGTTHDTTAHVSKSIISEGNGLSSDQQSALVGNFTIDDIKYVLYVIEDDKAPGPDRCTSCFLRRPGTL